MICRRSRSRCHPGTTQGAADEVQAVPFCGKEAIRFGSRMICDRAVLTCRRHEIYSLEGVKNWVPPGPGLVARLRALHRDHKFREEEEARSKSATTTQ